MSEFTFPLSAAVTPEAQAAAPFTMPNLHLRGVSMPTETFMWSADFKLMPETFRSFKSLKEAEQQSETLIHVIVKSSECNYNSTTIKYKVLITHKGPFYNVCYVF